MLMDAVDNHSVTVNVNATSDAKTSAGEVLVGGAFMGNQVTQQDGTTTVLANQEVNSSQLQKQSDYYGKPGADFLHEVTEAFQGALLSKSSGVSSPRAGVVGSVYEKAHDNATRQSGEQYVDTQNEKGESVDRQVPGGRLVYFVQEGNRDPSIISIFQIPKKK